MSKLKELKCEKCGGIMYRSREEKGMIGLFLIILGLLLLAFIPLLGIAGIVGGIIVGSKIRYLWICEDCGYKFERQMDWLSFRG